MKNSLLPHEMTCLNSASFHVGPEAFLDDWWEWLLEGLFGGSLESSACTEFTCHVYAPPPPSHG